MQLDRYADRLRTQLAAVADAGSTDAQALAERMSIALEPAIRLVLLEVLSEAAGDISRELAPGSVDVRLRGQEPEIVVTRAPEPVAAPEPPRAAAEPVDEEPSTFRTTLRLPERLKSQVEQAAAAEGVSVNTWLVRAVSAAVEPDRRRQPAAPPQTANRFTGWVR
jgi:hypothetical protein